MVYTGKRGMSLENLINYTNKIYLQKGIAVISKLPTPIKVTKSKGTRILNGFFEEKSTVDYAGVYRGKALYFEAKSTKELRFPLKNVHNHQIEFMYQAQKAGAICFFIIEFSGRSETFLVTYDFLHHYVVSASLGGRKSIPYDDFIYYSIGLLKSQNGIPLDYLSEIDQLVGEVA